MLMTEEEKTAYAENLAAMSEEQLINEVHDQVLGAAHSSEMSIFDEKASLCHNEALIVRNQGSIYQRGYNKAITRITRQAWKFHGTNTFDINNNTGILIE